MAKQVPAGRNHPNVGVDMQVFAECPEIVSTLTTSRINQVGNVGNRHQQLAGRVSDPFLGVGNRCGGELKILLGRG